MKRNLISPTNKPSITVLVTGDRIGDALLKWPAILGLKAAVPDCHLTWVAGRRASAFRGPFSQLAAGTIDRVVDCAKVGVDWRELFYSRPEFSADIVIATEPKVRNALLARRIPHRKFISPAMKFLLSDIKPSAGYSPSSVLERLQQLFELAIGSPIRPVHEVTLDDTLLNQAASVFVKDATYVGLSPGAGGKSKQWPLKNFIDTAVEQQKKGRIAAFFLGPEEEAMLSEISHHLPAAVFPEFDENYRRRGGALFSIALAKFMTVSVANDAGGGHLLSAGGQPLVTLYGHTSAEKFKPSYGRHFALNASTYNSQEMDAIPTHDVLDAIELMITS